MTRIEGNRGGQADRAGSSSPPPPKRPRLGEASSSRTETAPPARSQQAAGGSPPPRAPLPHTALHPQHGALPAHHAAVGNVVDDLLNELAAQPGDRVFGRPQSLPLAPHQRSVEAQQRRHLAMLAFEASIDQEIDELIAAFLAAQPDAQPPGPGEPVQGPGELHAQAPQPGPGAIHLDEQADQDVAGMIDELLAQGGEVAFQNPPGAPRRTIDVPPADRALIATFIETASAGESNKSTVSFLAWVLKRFSEWLGQQGSPSLHENRSGQEFDADVATYIEETGTGRISKALEHLQSAMRLRRVGAIQLPAAHRLAVGSDDLRLVDWFAHSAKAGDSNQANVENAAWSMRLFSTWRNRHQLPSLARSLDSETLSTELDDFIAETGSKNARTALRMLIEATNNEHVVQAFADHQLTHGTEADAVLDSAHALREYGHWLQLEGLGVLANRVTGLTAEADVQAFLAQGGDPQVVAAIHELREARAEYGIGAVSMPRRPEYAPALDEDEDLLGTFSEKAKVDGMNTGTVDTYVSAVRRFAASLAEGGKGSLKARLHDPTLDADLEAFIKAGGERNAMYGLGHLRASATAQIGRDPALGALGPPVRPERPRVGRRPAVPEPVVLQPPTRIGRAPVVAVTEAALAAALAPTLRTTRVPVADAALIDIFAQRKRLNSRVTQRTVQDLAGALRSFSKWLVLNGGPLLSERLHDAEMDQLMDAFIADGNWSLAETALRQLRAEFPAPPAAPAAVPVAPTAPRPAPPVVIAPSVHSSVRPAGPQARSLLNANRVDIEAAISAMRRRSMPRETAESAVGLPPGTLATVVDPQGRWLGDVPQMLAVQGLSMQQMQDFGQLVEQLRRQLGD
jgi:hypothetical protein